MAEKAKGKGKPTEKVPEKPAEKPVEKPVENPLLKSLWKNLKKRGRNLKKSKRKRKAPIPATKLTRKSSPDCVPSVNDVDQDFSWQTTATAMPAVTAASPVTNESREWHV